MTRQGELEAEVSRFAESLSETIRLVLDRDLSFSVKVGPVGPEQRITVEQADEDGIELVVGGKPFLRLQVRYRCSWNTDSRFMAINSSEFKLKVEGVAEPLLHYDYNRDGPANVPVAHLNIHAHRDELTVALMLAEGHRAKDRQRIVARGGLPRLSALHLPLGGHRFRPALEDILEMLILEFGVECTDDGRVALAVGRRRYRAMRLSAAVGDDPETAAAELRRQGYTVTGPDLLTERRDHSDRY